MSAVWLERAAAVAVFDPLAVDALDGQVLVLEGVTAIDDPGLAWCRNAPCVVIGCTPEGQAPSAVVDVSLVGGDIDQLEPILARISEQPDASRVLVDVLRAMPSRDVPSGLTLESLAYSALLAAPSFQRWLANAPSRPPRTFDAAPVRVERLGGELLVTLARPQNRNAFSAAMREGLFEALTLAVVDETLERVVLAGEGPVFSSGGDLTEFGSTPDVVRAHEIRTQRSVGRLLDQLADRTTVRVHGTCVGAGVELSAFAGHVVAAPDATFRLPEVAMGLIPGAGGTVSITRRIGRHATAWLALSGETIEAPHALRLGLIDEIE